MHDIWSSFHSLAHHPTQNGLEWALVNLLISWFLHGKILTSALLLYTCEWDHISVTLKVKMSCAPITFRRVMSSALQSNHRACLCHLLPSTCATWLWQTLGLTRHHLERFIYSQWIIHLNKWHILYIISFTTSFAPSVYLFRIKMTTGKKINFWIFPRVQLLISQWNTQREGDAHLHAVDGLLVATRSLSPEWELAEASGKAWWTETVCAGTAYSSIHTGERTHHCKHRQITD